VLRENVNIRQEGGCGSEEETRTNNLRKVTPTHKFISQCTEKGKGKKEILIHTQQKKEFNLRSKYVSNP
jgi:hypothetical protein